MGSKKAYMRRWLEMELMREEVMNDRDFLEPFVIDPELDLDEEDEVCEPTKEELEEDVLNFCESCHGTCIL